MAGRPLRVVPLRRSRGVGQERGLRQGWDIERGKHPEEAARPPARDAWWSAQCTPHTKATYRAIAASTPSTSLMNCEYSFTNLII